MISTGNVFGHMGWLPAPVWPSSGQWRTVLGVALLHLMAVAWLLQMPHQQQAQGFTRKPLTVVLLQDTVVPAKPSVQVQVQVQRQATQQSNLSTNTQPEPVSSALTGTPSVTEPTSGAAGQAVKTEPAAPLNLQLPKGWEKQIAPRHPAIEAGAGQRQPLTVENRIANALGGGSWVEERLGDGRLRLRNGNKCIYMERNRADDLNPFNALPTPALLRQEAC